MIITSSIASTFPMAGHITYCASKSFASYMGAGLNYELKRKVDVMSYEPGEVETKMIGYQKPGLRIISSARAAEVCLRDLGSCAQSRGAFRHEVLYYLLYILPKGLLNHLMFPMMKKILKRIRKREEREKKD